MILKQTPTPTVLSLRSSNASVVLRYVQSRNYINIFLQLVPLAFWEYLAKSVTRNLIARHTSTSTNPLKVVTATELIHFYGMLMSFLYLFKGIYMRIENTYGNDVRLFSTHFRKVANNFGRVSKLGERRFQQIWSSIDPTLDELSVLYAFLRQSIQRYLFYNIKVMLVLLKMFLS